MSEANKYVHVRWVEDGLNRGNVSLLDELYHEDCVYHEPSVGGLKGLTAVRALVTSWLVAFPDVRATVEDQVAEGDKVATRYNFTATHKGEFMGIAPSGKQVTVSGVVISRFAGGKIAEEWELVDSLGLLRQLGAVVRLE